MNISIKISNSIILVILTLLITPYFDFHYQGLLALFMGVVVIVLSLYNLGLWILSWKLGQIKDQSLTPVIRKINHTILTSLGQISITSLIIVFIVITNSFMLTFNLSCNGQTFTIMFNFLWYITLGIGLSILKVLWKVGKTILYLKLNWGLINQSIKA